MCVYWHVRVYILKKAKSFQLPHDPPACPSTAGEAARDITQLLNCYLQVSPSAGAVLIEAETPSGSTATHTYILQAGMFEVQTHGCGYLAQWGITGTKGADGWAGSGWEGAAGHWRATWLGQWGGHQPLHFTCDESAWISFLFALFLSGTSGLTVTAQLNSCIRSSVVLEDLCWVWEKDPDDVIIVINLGKQKDAIELDYERWGIFGLWLNIESSFCFRFYLSFTQSSQFYK